jgi:hypothetical protein
MFLFNFYRLYASLCAGVLFYVLCAGSFWISAGVAIGFRLAWFFIEQKINSILVNKLFNRHLFEFKQQLGPYGIRLANKAENDRHLKKSLAEVFVSDPAKLKKNVEQLEMFDTLYKAGMRPDSETYQVHDCKLKYGKYRLDKINSGPSPR